MQIQESLFGAGTNHIYMYIWVFIEKTSGRIHFEVADDTGKGQGSGWYRIGGSEKEFGGGS